MAMKLFVVGFVFVYAAVEASGRFGVINVAQDLGIQERQIGTYKTRFLARARITKPQWAVPARILAL